MAFLTFFYFFLIIFTACSADNNQEHDSVKTYVLVILAVSLLGIGIGQTAIATLGIPYIDDNVQSKQSALYMAITIGVRILGPAIGYYLGSLCMRISYDLTMSKNHADSDFIGAWYLGKLLLIKYANFLRYFRPPFFLKKNS